MKKYNVIKREHFDPENVTHLESYLKFITTGRWGDIQFFDSREHPVVISHINHVFANHYLPLLIKNLNNEKSTI